MSYSGYLNNFLNTTTSKYSQLRQKLTASEADGETEEDSHISRVLRAYYTEKGGRWPEWLGPDPRAPTVAPPVLVQSSVGSTYGQNLQQGYVSSGSVGQNPMSQTGSSRWGKGALSDLWDSGANSRQSQEQEEGSLRARPGMRAGVTSGVASSGPERNVGVGRPSGQANQPSSSYLAAPQARPLPSQRQGSYQTQNQQPAGLRTSGAGMDGPQLSQPLSGNSGTASDRLKQRLWGTAGRAGSPTPSSGLGNNADGYFNEQQSNPYDRGGSGAGLKPVVSANSPWSNNGNSNSYATADSGTRNPYSPGGSPAGASGAYGNGPYSGRGSNNGLPSGPRPQR